MYVSPLLVGGWCGLVTTALNCLPVGNLDGGRTMLVSVVLSSPVLVTLVTLFVVLLVWSQFRCLLAGWLAGWEPGRQPCHAGELWQR